MTVGKFHTSNLELTDKQIVNAIFKEFRKNELIDYAKQNVAHYQSTAYQKVREEVKSGDSFVFTYKEDSNWAFDKNGNLKANLQLDWRNREEAEKTNVLADRLIEIIESHGLSVEFAGNWFYSVFIKPRKDMEWSESEKRWINQMVKVEI